MSEQLLPNILFAQAECAGERVSSEAVAEDGAIGEQEPQKTAALEAGDKLPQALVPIVLVLVKMAPL